MHHEIHGFKQVTKKRNTVMKIAQNLTRLSRNRFFQSDSNWGQHARMQCGNAVCTTGVTISRPSVVIVVK